jgi:hypothetical protein
VRPSNRLIRIVGVEAEILRGAGNLRAHDAERLLLNRVGYPQKVSPALLRFGPAPLLICGMRGFGCKVDIFGMPPLNMREDLVARGIEGVKHRAANPRSPTAADVVFERGLAESASDLLDKFGGDSD